MAPDDTNVEKQAKRHGPAMIAIVASVVFVLVIFVGYLFYETDTDDTAEEQVEVPATAQ